MHRGHDHDHDAGGAVSISSAPPGHNRPVAAGRPVQWQTPHRHNAAVPDQQLSEPDLDLVETAFVEGFAASADPTSFLRLAHVPFEAVAADGARLALLRVEVEDLADVGSLTPHLGGDSFRYDPLPGRMVSRRKRLRFVYFDGQGLRPLDLAAALRLMPPP
jgi:hypothetical protein